jgi:hypothetical protein
MKIATWNLERVLPDTPKAEQQQRWLNRMDADVYILTETHSAIAPGPGYHLVSSHAPDRPGHEGERWVQIWIRGGEVQPLPTADAARTACARVTLANYPTCVIYGTVLPWQDSPWRSYGGADGAAFAAALSLQQADWQQLRVAWPEAALVVAGDFNQDLNVLPYHGSRRNKQALRQALATLKLDCLTFGDNDPVRRLINGQHGNTDHICIAHNRNVRLHQTFAWPDDINDLRGISDHFGVGIELSFD